MWRCRCWAPKAQSAGVLGKNAPPPLKPNSLEQSIVWDGRDDDGKAAVGGPFRVRVAAGLQVDHAGTVFCERAGPNYIGGVAGLAAGPDGRLYALSPRGGKGRPHWRGTMLVHVFRRDGSYEKTIKPPPAHLPEDRLKAIGAFRNDEGALTPLLFHPWTMSFYPYSDIAHQMAVTPRGQLLLAVVPVWPKKGTADRPWSRDMDPKPGAHLALIDGDGGIPFPSYAGPALLGKTRFGFPYLAVRPDGRAAYVTGLGKDSHAVYRVGLPERGPAEVFFGQPREPGSDQTHLNNPRGMACDGNGHLLIADQGNNRVVVIKEKDRSFAGSIAVEAPAWVGVNPKTAAVYVHSKNSLLKFSGWEDPRRISRLDLLDLGKRFPAVSETSGYRKNLRITFALDASAEPAVLWIGRNMGTKALLLCEDRGDTFTDPQPAGYYNSPSFWNLSTDPLRREVACRVVDPEVGGAWGHILHILNEKTGEIRRVDVKGASKSLGGPAMTHQGAIYRLGLDGQIFCMGVSDSITRHDRTGKWMPYQGTTGWVNEAMNPRAGLMENTRTGQSGWTRDFCVDRRGDVYLHHRFGQRGEDRYARLNQHPIRIDVYDGSTGKFKRTVITTASRNAIGPRVDPRGNIYLAEAVKPADDLYPPEFRSHLGGRPNEFWYAWMYGSLIKFGPQGGAVWWPAEKEGTFLAEDLLAALPASLQKQNVIGCYGGRIDRRTVLQGAEWCRFGFSHVSQKPLCHCIATDFDVDDFGRVFYPDLLRFRVQVVDTNGNEILTFGGYGNQDHRGPESYVRDPSDGSLRPRRKDDPKDLVSPFGRPEVAFAWIIGLAVSDRYVYVADELNQRVLRCRLGYSAVETFQVP